LGMDLEPALGEPTQLVEQEGGTGVDQQAAAQFRVGSMYRDVKRREPLGLNALPVSRRKIGKGEVGTV
jgi:hypothetical protein